MNVIGTRPDGWWKEREGAMARLVRLLEDWAAHTGDEVTVVFEQPPRSAVSSPVVEVAHAARGGPNSADDEIVRRLDDERDPASIRVVTSDRALADCARAAGAAVEPAAPFRSRIEP